LVKTQGLSQLPTHGMVQGARGELHSQGGVRSLQNYNKGTGIVMNEADQKRAASAYGSA